MKSLSSYTIITLCVCLSLIGLALLPLLPVKLTSSNNLPSLTVSFSMGKMSARVVEMEVTSKLEGALNRLSGVKEITSSSGNGSGSVTISLDRHVNLDALRFEVSSLVRQIWPELPEGVSYPTVSMNRPDAKDNDALIRYTLSGPGSGNTLQEYAENKILPKISYLKGIEKVTVGGALPMEWRLQYDYNQLKNMGISVSDIQSAITANSNRQFLGMNLQMVPGKEMSDTLDLSRIIVKKIGEKIVTLDQLVELAHKGQEPTNYYRINGQNVINLALYATEQANRIKVADQVYHLQETIGTELPKGYILEMSYDGTQYIRKELNKIYFRSGLTIMILLLFVLLVFRNWRYLLMITLTLAANICTAFILYYLIGVEIELYSLAGITLSLGLVIDNIIIMTDHLLHKKNKKVFIAILAGALTTIGSLGMIFFMDENIRLNLQDFARVMIVNLLLSLGLTLFFVPALIEKLSLRWNQNQRDCWNTLRIKAKINGFYGKLILFIHRRRVVFGVLLILVFGLPLFLLPARLTNDYWRDPTPLSGWKIVYNKTLGSSFYLEKLRPNIDMFLGGTLYLFIKNVYSGSYMVDRAETKLSVYASMPNGATLEQMNFLIIQMEKSLLQFPQIAKFQTSVNSANRASIQIYFKSEDQQSAFPNYLKDKLTDRALELNGASWSISGVGNGFSNEMRESNGNVAIKLLGYNYDELTSIAEKLKERLLSFQRVKEVTINNQYSNYKEDYSEYVFRLNKEELTRQKILPVQLYSTLKESFADVQYGGRIFVGGKSEQIKLFSKQSQKNDVWDLKEVARKIGDTEVRLSTIASIQKEQMPQTISKENQQYVLYVQYKYLGDQFQVASVQKKMIKEIEEKLPLGYFVSQEQSYYSWGKESNQSYLLLFLIIVIIFFICSILFNSLRQPLAIIFVIPLSYIGIFLTFLCFKLNFDQGGFASFVLLSGITVNASIYILNDYNITRRRYPHRSMLSCYLKAFNGKIIPILLTVVSTALSFLPFIVDGVREAFWFALAAGTIGGLCFSMIVIVLFLPLFAGIKHS